MSQISQPSANPIFYSPENNSAQEQFKSAQEKITPFDEKSITPRSRNSNYQDAFAQMQQQTFNNWIDFQQEAKPSQSQEFVPEWAISKLEPNIQDQDKQNGNSEFQFDDFPSYDEKEVNKTEDAGQASMDELQKHIGVDNQPAVNLKHSREMADLDDLVNQSANNASQQSNPFQKINEDEKYKYINPEQLPDDPFERKMILEAKQIKPINENFPFLDVISPDIQKNLAFTFHDSNQIQQFPNHFDQQPSNKKQQQSSQDQLDQLFGKTLESELKQEPQSNQKQSPQQIFGFLNQSQQSQKSDNNEKSGSKYSQEQQPQLQQQQQFQLQIQQQQQQQQQKQQQQLQQQQQQSQQQYQQQQNKLPQNQMIHSSSDQPQSIIQQTIYSEKSLPETANIQYYEQPKQAQSQPQSAQSQPQSQFNISQQSQKQIAQFESQTFMPPVQQNQITEQKNINAELDFGWMDAPTEQFNFEQYQNIFLDKPKQPELLDILGSQEELKVTKQQNNNKIQEKTLIPTLPLNSIPPDDENVIQKFHSESQIKNEAFVNDWLSYETEQKQISKLEPDKQQQSKQLTPLSSAKSFPAAKQSNSQRSDEQFFDIKNDWSQDIQGFNMGQGDQNQDDLKTLKSSQTSLQQYSIKNEEFKEVKEYELEKNSQTLKISNRYKDDEQKITPKNENSKEYFSNKTQSYTVSPAGSNDLKKNSNPFFEDLVQEETEVETKYKDIPWDDIMKKEAVPQGKKNLEPIVEVNEESMTHSLAPNNRNSAQFNSADLIILDESKTLQQSQSYKPQIMETYSEAKAKQSVQIAEQIVAQIAPKFTELLQITAQCENKVYELDERFNSMFNMIQSKGNDEFDQNTYNSQRFEMIKNLLEVYGGKFDKIQEQIKNDKIHSNHETKPQQESFQIQSMPQIQSPFDLNLEQEEQYQQQQQQQQQSHVRLSNPNFPPSGVKFTHSNYYSNGSPQQGFIPSAQQAGNGQSRFITEFNSPNKEEEDKLIKYKTNFQFQQQCLKGVDQHGIRSYRKCCLHENNALLDTYELFVSSTQEPYDNNGIQSLRVIVSYKNKASYDLNNFIVMINPLRMNDKFQVNPNKISLNYLQPNETIKQEFLFTHYDMNCVYLPCAIRYQINNYRYGLDLNRISQAQFSPDQSGYQQSFYQNHLQQNRLSDISVGIFKRTFGIQIARPANLFFQYNFHTAEELNEYEYRCLSEPFFLRSLEELVIYHPWLIQINPNCFGAKILLNENEFLIKLVSDKQQKCVIQMNQMDMDQKMVQHLLNFLSFLFQQMY